MNYKFLGALVALAVAFALASWGCGNTNPSTFDNGDGGGGADAGDQDVVEPDFPETGSSVDACQGLVCQIPSCPGGQTTSLTGTVYAPNGTLPLYNVIVYVPNAPLDPFPDGVACDQCGVLTSGSPIAVTLTDAKGNFTLTGVPAGTDIPLVMQLGKWRRKIMVPTVAPCTATAVGQKSGGVEALTRLPKKQSEGDMPHIAVTVGGCDKIGCIIPKIGIDPSEYAAGPTTAAMKPKKAVSFYNDVVGTGPSSWPPSEPLWKDVNQLKNFDLMIYSCECTEPSDADATSYEAVRKYLEAGGRIFTTDFMYVWYKYSTDTNLNGSPWSWPGGAPSGGTPSTIDQGFPKGKALADWLYYVGTIPPYNMQVVQKPPIKGSFPADFPYGYTFDNVFSINPKYGLEWAHSGPPGDPSGSPQHPRIITMNMPSKNPPSMQCGKAVHLDLHITQDDSVDMSYPAGCNLNAFREPELVTTFFFYDVSSCIQNDTQPPVPPTPQ